MRLYEGKTEDVSEYEGSYWIERDIGDMDDMGSISGYRVIWGIDKITQDLPIKVL